jgi:hypothetical protein
MLPCRATLSCRVLHSLLQYVVETRFVGERELGVSHTEIVAVKERVVEVAQPGPACPANAGEAARWLQCHGGTVPCGPECECDAIMACQYGGLLIN